MAHTIKHPQSKSQIAESTESKGICDPDKTNPYQEEIDYLKQNFKGQCKVLNWTANYDTIKLHPEELDIVFNFKLPKSTRILIPDIAIRSASIPEDLVFELVDFLKKEFESLHGTDRLEILVNKGLDWLKDQNVNLKSPPGKNPKSRKQKKKVHPTEKDGLDKLPSMRTAEDVINRIKWDKNLPKDQFIVGYIDRFKGLVEKYFTAFTWEDIASVDYTDLAIPKHRIQYFKYKGEKVWDKKERFDNVFGSLGSNITILDVIRHHEPQNISSMSQPHSHDTIPVSVVDDNTYPTSDSSQNPNINLNSTASDYPRDDYTYSSDEDSSDSDSDDSIEITIGKPGNDVHYSGNRNEYDEEPNPNTFWQDKMRPNYFLALRVTDENVQLGASNIQNYIIEQEPRYGECCIPKICLHITLCTVGLDTEEQLQNAVTCIQDVKDELFSIVSMDKVLKIKGVDNFFNRVVYGKVEYPPEFFDFVHHLKLCLTEHGIEVRDCHDFVPHMTIMKVSRPVARATGTKYVAPWLYSKFTDTVLGQQTINNVYLCQMGDKRQPDGFYNTATSIIA
ncbi:hypothetical protein CHS0354_011231 [Potamilus streckersoni]|uniref:Leukocyte receptor cluster member 9 n=1 Tax=Potamilus streckersoni TaxID=2493646 RepID=A0AAE0VF79_9BIVA|nr:hypothetical protein CHS0354_011231 [Potamilus streckersoni]